MATVYLECFERDNNYVAPIETVIVLFTMKYCELKLKIKLVRTKREHEINTYQIEIQHLVNDILNDTNFNKNSQDDNINCKLPYLIIDGSSYVAGLCACLRQIVKLSSKHEYDSLTGVHNLLGYKHSCLIGCSEASVWTKYCEVDLISLLNNYGINSICTTVLPIDLVRYEFHLLQPSRLHNIPKYSISKYLALSDISLDCNGIPEHLYAEGPVMSLADIIIFVCVHLILNCFSREDVFKLLPLTAQWYKRMINNAEIIDCLNIIDEQVEVKVQRENYYLPETEIMSLYKNDVRRYKPRNQIYTRQEDIENSLEIIKNMNCELNSINEPWKDELNFDWSLIPYDATPVGGGLPSKRLERKCQQLESMCKPILKLAKNGDTIVDFCSGVGHLGILIAYLLPNCTVILLENKEESLNRSKKRVEALNLNNVKFFQCNLDYFTGKFDIGTSLHACGVATDLVIRQCISQNAAFICCPCCYGKVQDCHHITYPRSNIYKENINIRDYLVLGHAADQTHDELNIKTKQGFECMNIIDNDRKIHAEEFHYKVHLTKLTPESCTPKNNLLIGISPK